MALIMSCFISLALSLLNRGFSLHTVEAWPLQWAKSYIIALPVALVVFPLVKNFVGKLTKGKRS